MSLFRRDAIGACFTGCIILAFLLSTADADTAGGRPNVLFIAIDDLNDWVGCLGGHPDVKTPNLDRLAKRGVLFANAYCAAPACNPSRAALMTGILPSTSGVYVNPQPWRQSSVLKDAVTLPQHFRAHGYKAMGSGKIYHGSYPDPASWDDYWPALNKQSPGDPKPPNLPLNGIPKTAHFDWGPVKVPVSDMGDWQVTDWVIGELKKRHDKPFFLACGIFRPHLPWFVPPEYFARYDEDRIAMPTVKGDDLDDVPAVARKIAGGQDHANVLKYGQWRKAVHGYLASIAFTDDCVGRVLDAFDGSAYRDNTVIVLWSDHGWHLGEKLHWRKFSLWEEATHNVLMFAGKGVPAGKRCETPVGLIDIYPTLLDLCGLPPREEVEGLSLAPLIRDAAAPWERPALTTHGERRHSLRTTRWRYTRYEDGTEELYDHVADPQEWTNRAADPEFEQVKKNLARWLPSINVSPSPYDKGEGKRKLRGRK